MSSIGRLIIASSLAYFSAQPVARALEAADVIVTPAGNVESTNVQEALEEIDIDMDRDVVYAEDYASGSTTGGIAEAIAACGSGTFSGRCRVALPKGVIAVSDLQIGGLIAGTTKSGLVVTGHGSGSSASSCGTVLKYTGSSGYALRLYGIRHSVFRDFCIDANGAATAIHVNASNSISALFMMNKLENIHIFNQTGAAILVGDTSDSQIDKTIFENIDIRGGTHCVKNVSGNAVNQFLNIQCSHYTSYGFEIQDGGALVARSVFGTAGGLGSLAAVMIRDDANHVYLRENHFELDSGEGIKTTGTNRSHVTEIVGNLMAIGSFTGADAVNYGHGGSLQITGNVFGVRSGVTGVDLRIQNLTRFSLNALIQGNSIASGIGTGGVISVATTKFEQGTYGPLRVANGTTGSFACAATVSQRLFHDTDCDGSRDTGEPYLDDRSNANTWGPALWALGGISGTAACSNAGLTCVDAHLLGNATSAGCGSTTNMRLVRCK